MKKVLLSSVAALAVFAAAAPAFANENPSVNGGANTPGAFDSREAYENQSEFVSARTVEEYLNGHMEDISAEAAQDPAVVAAKAEFDAVEGGSHLYGEKKAAYEAAFNTAFLNVRNKYVQQFQATYNNATEQEGKTYIQGETPEQANARYLKRVGAANNQNPAAEDKGATTPASKEEAKKSEAAAKNAGKAAGKALPKTSAVK